MTGFGEAHDACDTLAVSVEIRTINNRHFKLSLRTSEGYSTLEPQIDALVRQFVRRGSIQVNLRVRRAASEDDYNINGVVLRGYRRQLEQLQSMIGPHEPVRLEALLAMPGVVEEHGRESVDPEQDWPLIERVARGALEALSSMRAAEGAALQSDLRENCAAIAAQLDVIAQRAPLVAEAYRERLTDRVNKALAGLDVLIQPSDLIREVSLFIDRSDISEEIVRLRSHLEQFEATVAHEENSGRKLEFIAQEMGRETNTIGSKANDTDIAHRVVEIKSALERIREQVQNVE